MDPKKRLQVVQKASPSLRVSVAPKKKLDSASTVNQGDIIVQGAKQPVKSGGKAGGAQNNDPVDKAGSFVNAIGRFLGPNTAKVANTTQSVAQQIIPSLQQFIAAQRGDTEGFRKASEQISREQSEMKKGKGGLFNAGGVVTGDEFRNGPTATNARKFAGAEVSSGVGEILPWLIGAKEAQLLAQGGKGAAKVISAGAGTAGVGSAAGQYGAEGKVNPVKTAIDAAIGGAASAAGAGISKLISKFKGKGATKQAEAPASTADVPTPSTPAAAPDKLGISPPRTTPGDDIQFRLKFNDPAKAITMTNSSKIGKAVASAWQATQSQDPAVLVMHALANTTDKGTVRDMLTQLVPGLDNATTNAVVHQVQKLDNAGDVGEYLWEVVNRKGATTLATPDVPVQSVTDSPEPLPTGAKPTEKTQTIAPNGARITTTTKPQGTPLNETPIPPSKNTDKPTAAAANATTPAIDITDPAPVKATTQAGELRKDGKVSLANRNLDNANNDTKDAVNAVMSVLGDAKKVAGKNANALSVDRAKKVTAATAASKSVGGQEGYYAALGNLKGKSPKQAFTALKDKIDQKQVDALFSHVQNLDSLRPFEKINVQTALAKVFGSAKGAPTKGDIKLIEKAFGRDLAKAIEENVSTFEKIKTAGLELANVPRSLLSAFDFSAPFRQGIVTSVRYPKEFFGNFKGMFKAFGDEKAYKLTMESIANNKNYDLMNKSGLALTDMDALTSREEDFMSSYAEKIPLAGRGVRASGRAYTAFLNKTRADVFNKLVKDAEAQGLDVEDANKLTKDIAKFVNSATGRGSLGPLESSAAGLNAVLFSPRLWASRINLLNPVYYAKLEPFARKEAIKSMAGLAGAAATVLSLAAAAGAEVELDPKSADFAKIKVGDTRYDILGGFQQNIVLAARMITGEKTNSVTGEKSTLGEGYGDPSRFDLAIDFAKNKLNPVAGFAGKLLEGKTPAGEPINPAAEFGKLFVPLNAQAAKDLYDSQGPLGVLMAAPGLLGFGSQTYGDSTTNGGKEATLATDVSKGVPNGDKGKSVSDTLANQKKAETDAVMAYKKKLNDDDKALLGASKNDLDTLLKNKKIDQKQYDRAGKLKDDVQKLKGTYKEDKVKIPEGVKSTNASAFYKKYNALKADDRKKYLDSDKVDESAKKIAADVNKQRPAGLPEFKATNRLAKDYADFENKYNAKDSTAVDKRNALNTFLTKSVKNQYGNNAKDIYAEGNSADFKALLDNGSVAKKDLEEAIAIDNALYDARLTSSLKFSKKAREALGYAMPGSYAKGQSRGGVSSGSSGGGSSESKRAYLSSYLTDFKGITAPPSAPTKAKKVSLKAPALPRTGGKAKVSIRL